MANEDRATTCDLEAQISVRPWDFDFFQAVRRLESAASDKPRVGQARIIDEDIVRFGQQPTLAFEPSTLAAYEPADGSTPSKMLVYFLGLLGPNGPMPLHITEFVIDWMNGKCERLERLNRISGRKATVGSGLATAEERVRERLRIPRFLDIFHQRMIALFYSAWARHQQTVSFDRGDDSFGRYIGSLIGYGSPVMEKQDEVPHVAKLHFAGHLVSQTRHPEGLQAIIESYFGVRAKVIEFVGQWTEIPEHRRSHLGLSNCGLGKDAFLGDRIWDCQQKFRLRLGPMKLQKYEQMLPGAGAFKRLVGWVRNYVGDALCWDVNLVLAADEAPDTRLGWSGRLGYTSWTSGRKVDGELDDLIIDPVAAAESNRRQHA